MDVRIPEYPELAFGVGVVMFYLGVYKAIKSCVRETKVFQDFLRPDIQHEFISYIVSMINSILQSFFLARVYYLYMTDSADFESEGKLWTVFFFFYNIYDTYSCCRFNLHVFRTEPGLVIHHAMVLLAMATAYTAQRQVLYFFVCAGLCEVNSVFLHLRTILKMIHPVGAWIKWPLEFFQIITHVSCRYSTGAYVFYLAWTLPEHMTNWWYQFGTTLYLIINTVIASRLALEYIAEFRKRFGGAGRFSQYTVKRFVAKEPLSSSSAFAANSIAK